MLASQELLNAAVSSELPDPETNPKLFEFVKSHMIHGPCGNVNKECPCMAGEGVLIEIAVKKFPNLNQSGPLILITLLALCTRRWEGLLILVLKIKMFESPNWRKLNCSTTF